MAKPATASLVAVGGRAAFGALAIAFAAVVVFAATAFPLPTAGAGPQSSVVTPVAAPQQRICAGPVLRLGEETGQDATTAISLGQAEVTRAATSGTPTLENMDPSANEANDPPQRLLLPPPADGVDRGILAGSQSQNVDSGEYVGFAASECIKPASDLWLVGGSTVTGRTTLLALNNPSSVNATVNLAIFAETGPVHASGTGGIVVPPGGQRIFSLAAFAPGVTSPVVHVTSMGGQVSANLQESILRTLTPGGVDVIGPTTRPATLSVIPGVVTTASDALNAVAVLDGYDDISGVLRVLAPGTGPVDVTVAVTPEAGSDAGNSSTFTVQGGVVSDIPLGDFGDGTWTLTVTSSKPVVVAARTSTVTLAGSTSAAPSATATPTVVATDLGWFVAAPELTATALVSVASGPAPELHLVNGGLTSATVTIGATQGAGTTVTIPASGAFALPVSGAISYTLEGFDTLYASVSYLGDGQLAGFVVGAPSSLAKPITVYQRFG